MSSEKSKKVRLVAYQNALKLSNFIAYFSIFFFVTPLQNAMWQAHYLNDKVDTNNFLILKFSEFYDF